MKSKRADRSADRPWLLLVNKPSFISPHCSTTCIDAVYCYRPSSVVCQSVCHSSEPCNCKNSWTDRDAVWFVDSCGLKKPCIRWGTMRISIQRGNLKGGRDGPLSFEQERGGSLWSIGTFCRELCNNGWTDRDAVSGILAQVGPSKHLLNGGAHWRNLANTIEPSVCCGDAAFL